MSGEAKWARAVLAEMLCGQTPTAPPDGNLATRRAACFVTLHEKDGCLRGCIGTLTPVYENLAEEITRNAKAAATRDPRFAPVSCEELADLTIHVDVLSEPETISSAAELDVVRYGVIVSSGMRRGVLLPDLDGVTEVAQQIDIARQKAGIRPDETVQLQRFTVTRCGEETP